MKKLLFCALALTSTLTFGQNDKKELDRKSILEMEGCYKVTFDFAETFSPDTAYVKYDDYSSQAIEYVFAIEDEPDFISLQHILVVNDTFIVKHWRQDWLYENRNVLMYDKDRTWDNEKISKKAAKGTWTQKVFQVDDSPRYEGYGTWVHVDGKHYWESTADAPLPRRELTVRQDYNVTRRHSRMEITENGWMLEQDNEKIYRDENGEDHLIVWEKGHEIFTRGDYDCQPAIDWWKENYQFWADVRTTWESTIAANKRLHFERKVDKQLMYQKLFALGEEHKAGKYNQAKAQKEIQSVINAYLNQ
ncbi:hypothetical protein CW751_04725 [Brumimicrobium salinarum]|uniref:Uncharacterized protein n=1 Tax=Brumimicrobium salinarum TaxID=2058658 RepID=A0A2I0R455_9FLAO|nr:DUF6607 family protein [Brumimicrobium salinarum]PKR81364.1 hypothetical protein CW751_04725 [Brumimicrobium salinarum]